ncbi:MAG: HAD family phosphatase [Vicinamibacterales bacterium]
MPISAIIFDMDGLLVDTEPLYQASWQRAARALHYDIDDALYARFIGRPTTVCETILVETLGSEFPLEAFRQQWPQAWRHEVDRVGVVVKPGVHQMLQFARERRLLVALATSKTENPDFAQLTLDRAGLAQSFAVRVCGEEVACGKPAPDIFLEAAKRLGRPASECVALEDSEAGILAVRDAGMYRGAGAHWPASAIARDAARRVVPTLHEAREVVASLLETQEQWAG